MTAASSWNVVAGVAFLASAAWTLRGDELTDDEADKARRSKGVAIVAVGRRVLPDELGDKTMLATITLVVFGVILIVQGLAAR